MNGDPVLEDAIFLTNHPGWTPRDLREADAELIETMAAIARARAQRKD